MKPHKARLYWETLRHLRPIQIYGRLRHVLPRSAPRDRAPPRQREFASRWLASPTRSQSYYGRGVFRFLDETRSLAFHGWDDPAVDRLWRYNLHYFDDLNAEAAFKRREDHRELIEWWIAENLPVKGTAWEPYPTSLRIVNWVKWSLQAGPLSQNALRSLANQARWLMKRLEIHLLGNHLLANAKALIFAGLFFEGHEADKWLKKGQALLLKQLPEQVLGDGGHFELSPMYHALVLEDLLDLINIFQCYSTVQSSSLFQILVSHTSRMCGWLYSMCHPDGEISFFNDAAIGIAPAPRELFGYAERLKVEVIVNSEALVHLQHSGYIRLESRGMVALLDVAPVGPDFIPGHAHADTLSFELSLGKKRFLVNSGTSCYGESAERLRQRGTAAHNTVQLDAKDSSEVWKGFRVARRARPQDLIVASGMVPVVSCAHDGYRALPGHPLHRREWKLLGRSLIVTDWIQGSQANAVARFHFHPQTKLFQHRDGRRGAATCDGARLLWSVEKGSAHCEETTYHPMFGVSQRSKCLAVNLDGGMATVRFGW